MVNFVTTKKAIEILGIHPNTLRNWDKNKKIECIILKKLNVSMYVIVV